MPSGSPSRKSTPASQDIELIFIDPLPKEYECPICQQVLRYPVQFDQCDHHCCSSCLPDIVKSGGAPICPVDSLPINRDKVYVDKQLQKTIQQLKVKCSFHEKGCSWAGILKGVPTHIPECDYAPLSCPKNCGIMLERRFQEQHLTEDCQKRSTNCDNCEKSFRADQLDEHFKACPKMPLDCPNRCGKKKLPREDMQKHLTVCPKAGSACPFSEFGCQYKGERTTLQQHIREEPTRHLSILCDGVVELKRMLQAMQLNIGTIHKTRH